jgi:lichenan operon transcriptional antiterminator
MLTERQAKIFLMLTRADEKCVSEEKLQDEFSVGGKSISNDINAICREDFGGRIYHKNGSYYLEIADTERKNEFVQRIISEANHDYYSDPAFRTKVILSTLLKARDYVRSAQLQDTLFVSKSTLTNDLSRARKTLALYGLGLEIKPHHGLKITGDEASIRKLIISQLTNTYLTDHANAVHIVHTETISDILTNALLRYQFKVSDVVFQNLIIHIAVQVQRLTGHNRLQKSKDLPLAYYHVKCIAEDIFRQCAARFGIDYDDEEVKFLATEIQCKRDYNENTSISQEVNNFVIDALHNISVKMDSDFSSSIDLRISLALHTAPLIHRLQNGKQLTNDLAMDVKQGFPYAYDLANEYANSLCKKYGTKPNEDEIAYLALHFIAAIKRQECAGARQKLLLICEQRRSNTILIEQQILNWFKDYISSISIINRYKLDETDISEYDVIVTTSEDILAKLPDAVLIGLFPAEKDRLKIEMAFSGITKSTYLLNCFKPELFFSGTVSGKEELIDILCKKASEYYHLDDRFAESVNYHESVSNTFFGNHIAMPHPDEYMTKDSFICVGIPSSPVQWDDRSAVQLVLLVSIKANDPSALRIWQYLSFLVTDDSLLRKILQNPTYQGFYSILSGFYQEMLDK